MTLEKQKRSSESPSLANERRCIRCREVDISLAEASGGGAWGPTLIPAGGEGEDLAGSGSACLQSMEEVSMGRHLIIRMGGMGTPSIHIRNSQI